MKKKIISGLTWTGIAIVIICFPFTHLMAYFVSVFAAFAHLELIKCAQTKNKAITVFSTAAAAAIPLIVEFDAFSKLPFPAYLLIVPYFMILLVMMLAKFDETKFQHVLMAVFSSIVMPLVFSTILLVRSSYKVYGLERYTYSNCFFLIFAGLFCAWMTDAMAYFVGVKFGKRKMAPKISPKKSIEGAVGGVLLTAAINTIVWFVFWLLAKYDVINPIMFPLWFVPVASVILSVLAILGDLTFSVIKRNYGIKDFGFIMGEGNGGVMDRFDSYSFVMPTIYVAITVFEALRV